MTQLLSDSSKNRKIGIALVTLTTLMFASLDTSAKWLVLSLPVLQVVWMRFFTHVVNYISDIRTQNGLEHPSSGQYQVAIATWCYFGDHDSV